MVFGGATTPLSVKEACGERTFGRQKPEIQLWSGVNLISAAAILAVHGNDVGHILWETFTVKLLAIAVFSSLFYSTVVCAAEHSKVLMLTQSKGFKHDSVNRDNKVLSTAEIAMTQLGQQSQLFVVTCTQDAALDFRKENLQKYDIVMFYTTGKLEISQEAQQYFVNVWLKEKGHGWIGFHSAADTYTTEDPKDKWYWDLCGGTFKGHPWNSRDVVTIRVHDTKHPAMIPFGNEFQISDEIYWYAHWIPENVHVLMSLNLEKCKTKGELRRVKEGDTEKTSLHVEHVPVSWCRSWGEGKIFYNNLGHNEGTWSDKRFLESTVGAIRWIRGDVEGTATPNPELSKEQQLKARKDAGLDK